MFVWFFEFWREEVVQSERRSNHVHTTILRKEQHQSYGFICQARYGKLSLFYNMLARLEQFLAQTKLSF